MFYWEEGLPFSGRMSLKSEEVTSMFSVSSQLRSSFPLIHFTSPMVKDRYDSQNPQLETHRSKKTRFYLQLR